MLKTVYNGVGKSQLLVFCHYYRNDPKETDKYKAMSMVLTTLCPFQFHF